MRANNCIIITRVGVYRQTCIFNVPYVIITSEPSKCAPLPTSSMYLASASDIECQLSSFTKAVQNLRSLHKIDGMVKVYCGCNTYIIILSVLCYLLSLANKIEGKTTEEFA